MKPIETGCLAVVLGAYISSNNGKVVTVGRYLGDIDYFEAPYNKDHWEIDTAMITSTGFSTLHIPQFLLMRIDGDVFTDEEIEELELVK